jgi:hypothetical protein
MCVMFVVVQLTNSQLEHMYSRCTEVEAEMRKLSEMAGLCRLLALSSELVSLKSHLQYFVCLIALLSRVIITTEV